jgi:hypothetical protein
VHEKRNFIMILLLLGSIIWAVIAWLILAEHAMLLSQRAMSLMMVVSLSAWLLYALKFEDKLPDHLRNVAGAFYYEADGLSFMPMVRLQRGGKCAELCVYYQNRYENMVEAIVHLRPPPPGESFVIQPGTRDVHFAFKAGGGDFGVIHQPIAVPRNVQGQVIEVKMAAATWYPRSHGACLRRRAGMPCGTVLVDWVGNPLKIGVHDVSGEIPLNNPVTLHLAMPEHVKSDAVSGELWRQEQLAARVPAMA